MQIFVVPRFYVERQFDKDPDWIQGKWIISIFSSGDVSPIPDRYNILKLEFDDITELLPVDAEAGLILFNEDHAKQIHEFFDTLTEDRQLFVHCDAGVSRSGAVGYLANEYFNKYKKLEREASEAFTYDNKHIMPNPLVTRLLKRELFGQDYSTVFETPKADEEAMAKLEEKFNEVFM